MAPRAITCGSRIRLTILLVAAAWASVASGEAATAPPPAPGSSAPNFALTTQQNDRLWLTQLRGRAVVLAFGCTTCGACPDVVPRLSDVARRLGDAPGRRVFFVLVTVDPARDSATVLREFGGLTASGHPRGSCLPRTGLGRSTSSRTATRSKFGGRVSASRRAAR